MKLTHPKLPFLGILDRVQDTGEGVEVVDFKTGKPSDKHRKQLLRYALLWWRKTGDAPVRVSARTSMASSRGPSRRARSKTSKRTS